MSHCRHYSNRLQLKTAKSGLKGLSESIGVQSFNCLTAHVAKLSQLHPKHSAQTLAENVQLLGLNHPNHKPKCFFKSLKKKHPDLFKPQRNCTRNKGMRQGGVEEENCAEEPRVSPPCPWNCLHSHLVPSPQPHERPAGLGSHMVKETERA